MKRVGDWMQTYSGRMFWPIDPRPEEVFIEDIAHALSNQCRFAGHCESFYSVAQHSVIVAQHVPMQDRKWALLHDASEAYLTDLIRPLKRGSQMGQQYQLIELALMECIAYRFGLEMPIPESVKEADERLLLAEARDLMKVPPHPWAETVKPFMFTVYPTNPSEAKAAFMEAWRLVTTGVDQDIQLAGEKEGGE